MHEPQANYSTKSRFQQILIAVAAVAFVALGLGIGIWNAVWLDRLEEVGSGAIRAQDAADSLRTAAVGLGIALVILGSSLLLLQRAWRNGSDSRYRALLEQSPNGTLMAYAANLKIVDANPAAQRSLGLSLGELRSLTLDQLFIDPSNDGESLQRKLRHPVPRSPLHLQQRCKNGSVLDVELTGHGLELDGKSALAYTVADITVKRKIEAQLLEKQQHLDHLAHHDQLTGLPNRLFIADFLPGAIEEARAARTMLAVLFLDLDHFKHINDTRGHETGDKLLKTVAQRVRETVREEDVVVRMGGDEFIVVLKAVKNPALINETAARVTEVLAEPVVVDGRPLVTTVSIGVSLFPRDGQNMGELLRHSDTAMYQAKDRGRNNFQLFSPVMDRKLKERVAIEQSLRAALQNNQLDVHYQPIIDIQSREVVALEALLRWQHPSHGFIPPGRFIAVAEETGLIVPLGDFVLQRVFQDASRWRKGGARTVPISVNISAVQLQRSNLRQSIIELTRKHQLNPELLQLELTESVMFERRERDARGNDSPLDTISQLRELGVRIAIDDFGTGYSSLSYLKRWHVDYLKIDRSFVRDLVTDMSDLAIVSAIVALARHLNIQVVAEGIEGWQQLEKLRQLGCELAQGYLFAKPAPAAHCRKLLSGMPLDLIPDDAMRSFDATLPDGSISLREASGIRFNARAG
jgi:diguanylate cyclase (GGDEF)-like protein/PAS domain S-box-containing protein